MARGSEVDGSFAYFELRSWINKQLGYEQMIEAVELSTSTWYCFSDIMKYEDEEKNYLNDVKYKKERESETELRTLWSEFLCLTWNLLSRTQAL